MGKWDKLKGKVPKAPVARVSELEKPGFLDKVNAAKDKWRSLGESARGPGQDASALFMREFSVLTERKRELSEEESAINVELEALDQLLQAWMEERDLDLVKSEAIGKTFFTKTEPYVSFAGAELKAWIQANAPEMDHLNKPVFQSVQAWIKELLEAGQDAAVPPCVKVTLKTQMQCRKS